MFKGSGTILHEAVLPPARRDAKGVTNCRIVHMRCDDWSAQFPQMIDVLSADTEMERALVRA